MLFWLSQNTPSVTPGGVVGTAVHGTLTLSRLFPLRCLDMAHKTGFSQLPFTVPPITRINCSLLTTRSWLIHGAAADATCLHNDVDYSNGVLQCSYYLDVSVSFAFQLSSTNWPSNTPLLISLPFIYCPFWPLINSVFWCLVLTVLCMISDVPLCGLCSAVNMTLIITAYDR